MFAIPPGLRPVRTTVAKENKSPEPTPRREPERPSTAPEPESEHLEASRAYYLGVARKLHGSRRMALPKPKALFCCCLTRPKVKDERSASFLELSKLLLVRDT